MSGEASFAVAVLAWHARHGRHDLPWQRPGRAGDPYRVWVSEIMLQQTRVSKVVPYFERFVARFPEVRSLADAPLDEVLHLWSGLGYYARARNLHRAAREIRDAHGGRFPERLDALLALPGVGRSTAGAVLSLALGQRHPILDGNVKRVLARCFGVPGWPGRGAVARRLWELAEALTPHREVGAYNQAMMDLGATLCRRRGPECHRCPLAGRCVGLAEGRPEAYPGPRPARPLPGRAVRMLLVRDPGGRVLLQRRPPAGLWGGLWGLPELGLGEGPLGWCRQHLGGEPAMGRGLPVRSHAFSHFRLEIHPQEILLSSAGCRVLEGEGWVWYNPAQPDARGLAAPVARLLREIAEPAEEKP